MLSVEEAQHKVLNESHHLKPLKVHLHSAVGLILAENIYSAEDIPPFDNSAVDGYALRSEDVLSATSERPITLKLIGEVRAGQSSPFFLQPGEAVRIFTGAPVPGGADGVIMQEFTTPTQDRWVRIHKSVQPGENIRHRGEDIQSTSMVLGATAVLTPASIGVLASLGLNWVQVYPPPRTTVFTIGDELVSSEEIPGPGQIRDSNCFSLTSAIKNMGISPFFLGREKDNDTVIQNRLQEAFNQADLLLISGGVSVGEYDRVKQVAESLGCRRIFWQVNQRPGKPLYFGVFEKDSHSRTLVFGLPGNPVSSLVCFYEFVYPAIRKIMGFSQVYLPRRVAILTEEISKKIGRFEFICGVASWKAGTLYVQSAGPFGSHILTSLSRANCLILCPEKVSVIPTGAPVEIQIFPEFSGEF